jgi:glutaredoxin
MPRVTLFVAEACHLCEEARRVVREVHAELDFEFDVVDIEGNDELELAYRALLPVVEIDGRRAFTFEVDPEELRERLVGAVES